MPRHSFLLALLLAAPACGDTPPEPVARRVDLRAATGVASPQVAGVALAPDGGRVVLDQEAGLFRIAADGTATRLRSIAELPEPDVAIRPPFTDLVALGDDQFAMTAIGVGYLLDLTADTMNLHFCYEPGGFPDDQEQRTAAVAFDATTNKLYAQPQTFDGDGNLLRADVAQYDRATGVDEIWREVPSDFAAGGMYAPGDGGLILGAGSRLYRYDYATYTLTAVDDLARYGVDEVAGLAFDAAAGNLIVVDGQRAELVEVPRAELSY